MTVRPVPREAALIVNAHSRKGQDLFRQAKTLLEEAGIRPAAAPVSRRRRLAGLGFLPAGLLRQLDRFVLEAERSGSALQVVIATTRGPSPRMGDVQRRLDRGSLRDALKRWSHAPRHVYVCGANRFVESVTSALVAEGIAAARIRTERYGGA